MASYLRVALLFIQSKTTVVITENWGKRKAFYTATCELDLIYSIEERGQLEGDGGQEQGGLICYSRSIHSHFTDGQEETG